ncbi:MAG: hypothetical protein CMF39_06365 [Legionellaceae bacterium]|nr:hypothetical protein [Legionellaceae bacterium]|tara:strand:+ start:1038 stop:1271 length:234 start_codon:yes stop_codon:yes gene_type:complete
MEIRKTQAAIRLNNREFDKAVEHFGTLYKLAQALGLNMSSIYKWEKVPPRRCYELENITMGKIKKEKLRPDLFGGKK